MTRAQVDELHELKRQETKLRIAIKRSEKKHMTGERYASMIEQREALLQQMKPLRDQLFSEIKDSLAAEYSRLYYGGMTSYQIADLFGYRSGETITAKIKEAERQVTGS